MCALYTVGCAALCSIYSFDLLINHIYTYYFSWKSEFCFGLLIGCFVVHFLSTFVLSATFSMTELIIVRLLGHFNKSPTDIQHSSILVCTILLKNIYFIHLFKSFLYVCVYIFVIFSFSLTVYHISQYILRP